MQKLLLAIVLLVFLLKTIAQQNLPTIRATSEKIDIRVGDDYFSKGGWTLEPNKNPDIFSIGSKWHYENKRVSFITDIDSISFNVQPGKKYDFIILKENIPCHIQILTVADPVFFNTKALVSLLAGFAVFIILLYINRNRMNARQFLQFGYWVVILFWVMTIVSGYIHGNYNHLKNTISELGAIGTKSELFTSCSLTLLAALNILFCIGFYKESKTRRISVLPAILCFAMPLSMIWAGVFTLGNEFHSTLGILPFFIIIGSILSFFLWKHESSLKKLRITGLLSFMIMMLILTRFIKPFGYEFEGLVQRFFYLGWTIWTIGISYFISRE